MNDRERLITLLLEQATTEFADIKGAPGCFPEKAVIVLKDQFHPKFFGLGKPARAWIYDGSTLDDIDLSEAEKLSATENDRVYYRTARFAIGFPDDLSAARLTASFGPKFGRVYLYDVIADESDIALGPRRLQGMS